MVNEMRTSSKTEKMLKAVPVRSITQFSNCLKKFSRYNSLRKSKLTNSSGFLFFAAGTRCATSSSGVADALKIWIRAIVGHLHKALICGFENLRIGGLQAFRDDLFRRVFMRRRVMNALDETLKEALHCLWVFLVETIGSLDQQLRIGNPQLGDVN